MTRHASPSEQPVWAVPRLPGWVSVRAMADAPEPAFFSGAALATLHPVVTGLCAGVPLALLHDRLALRAAERCVRMTGRPERAAELRDAVHLLRPGEAPGPAGAVFALWRSAVRPPKRPKTAARDRARGLDEPGGLTGPPVMRAAQALDIALIADPGAEAEALIHADTELARALGWRAPLPLLGLGLSRKELRAPAHERARACHGAILSGVTEALRQAHDLARRAQRFGAIAPKLRTKGAARALALFLSTDAVSPTLALTAPGIGLSDRSARRLCDRLVALGGARELSGRAAFRLYGL